MWTTAAAMQAFDPRLGNQVFIGKRETICGGLRGSRCYWNTTPHPEQGIQIYADGCSRLGIEGIGNIDPCAHFRCLRSLRDLCKERKGQSRAAGTFWSNDLGDRSYGQAALEQYVDILDPSRRDRADDPGRRGERGGDAVSERSFDLCAQGGGGGHIDFRLIFALQENAVNRDSGQLALNWVQFSR
jgi:hypothetical protein